MLYWSTSAYIFTVGVGCLAITGMSAELWQNVLPVWAIMIFALVPLVLFVFADPDDIPAGVVRFAHAAGAIWYMLAAIGLLIVLMFNAKPLPRGWPIYPPLVAIGAVPCCIVLCRDSVGKYLPKPKVRLEQIRPPTEGWEGIMLFKEVTSESEEPEAAGDQTSSR